MARKAKKRQHMGYKLLISRDEGKTGTWEQVGYMFRTRFEAGCYHWRYYLGTPHRIVGVYLSLAPVQGASSSSDDQTAGARKPARSAA